MNDSHWFTIVQFLQQECQIEMDDPLTDQEIADVQGRFDFLFPVDLREFLQTALPVSPRFPDWRNGSEEELRDRLGRPLEGILFDVEHNRFWLPEWGDRPDDLQTAFDCVRQLVARAPKLIPVYSHRMMPDRPHEEGNPVFSVHQTDIIIYGIELRDYFIREFFSDEARRGMWPVSTTARSIEFWNIVRFRDTRWDENGMARFDNRRDILPQPKNHEGKQP